MVRILLALLLVLSAAPARAQAPDAGRLSLDAEYLVWWIKDSPAPVPLVSTARIGLPGTRILLGREDVDTGEHHGARFTLGYALTADRRWAVEASGFVLPETRTSKSVASSGGTGSPTLVIPYFDVNTGGEAATLLSNPRTFSGNATESLRTQVWGVEVLGATKLDVRAAWRVDLLGGVRYLALRERYLFDTSSPAIAPPDVFQTRDDFDARNDFYGLSGGVRGRYELGRVVIDATVKVAAGVNRQTMRIDGMLHSNTFAGGTPINYVGGYFAQATNMGNHQRDVFAVAPEGTARVGYRVTPAVTAFVGYSFLYLSNVARPAKHLEHSINPTQNASFGTGPPNPLLGAPRPHFRWRESDLWTQGLSLGVALSF